MYIKEQFANWEATDQKWKKQLRSVVLQAGLESKNEEDI
jgi:hypothetical protein